MARQPNTSDADGMWGVTRPNQQRNAKYGQRWPETYVAYTPIQYYYRRMQSGNPTQITDGTSTNAYGFASTESNPGTSGLTGSSWGYSYGPNTDAISFVIYTPPGHTGTEKFSINRLSMGAMNTHSTTKTNNDTFVIEIVNGMTTGGASVWYKEYAAGQFTFYGNSSGYANHNGVQLLTLPSVDSNNVAMSLDYNNWYTAMLGWTGTGENFQTYSMTPAPNSPYERTISTQLGNATMQWAAPTFNGSAWRGSGNGTAVNSGQFQVFGVLI